MADLEFPIRIRDHMRDSDLIEISIESERDNLCDEPGIGKTATVHARIHDRWGAHLKQCSTCKRNLVLTLVKSMGDIGLLEEMQKMLAEMGA